MTTEDVYDGTIIIRDIKGNRTHDPYEHVVPLIPAAQKALEAMNGGTHGPHIFTVSGGHRGAGAWMVRDALRPIVDAMREAGELKVSKFTPGTLRSTVETQLLKAGVPKEQRAYLQSHGLSGVQSQNYIDEDLLLEEKRANLELLYELVTPPE